MLSKKMFKTSLLALFVGVFLALAPRASFAQEPKKKAQGDLQVFSKLTSGLSDLLNAPQKEKEENESQTNGIAKEENSNVKAPLPVPQNVGVLLKTPSLRRLDEGAKVFFKQTSDAEFSALAALSLTSFGSVLEQIDLDAPAAIAIFCESTPPKATIVLPVAQERFEQFVDALNATVQEERQEPKIDKENKTAKTRVMIGDAFETEIRQIDPNYVAIVLADDSNLFERFQSDALRDANEKETAPGLNDVFLSLELSPRGAFFLTEPNRPIWREFKNLTTKLQRFAPDFPIEENLTQLRQELRMNLGEARVDFAVDDAQIYVSTQRTPKAGSSAAKRVASYPQLSSFDPSVDRYFVVLPYSRGAVCGQTEIAPTTAATLEPPYNRVRYVEFSLALPQKHELAAESWLFFIEVDDAKTFVKEAVLPNAREIGRYVGEREAEAIGAELFGAMSARRRERQIARGRRGDALVDPNEAAARGGALGALLGAAIGESSGEKTAMKEYPIDGYTAYISDLETYARQKALMKAEAQGVQTPQRRPDVFIDQERPLLSAIGGLIESIGEGENDMQHTILSSANERARLVDDAPLYARTGFWVVLDDQHLLFGLGNTDLLRSAINNWRSLTTPSIRYLSFDSDAAVVDSYRGLCAKTPNLKDVQAIGTIRIDLSAAQENYRWFLANYLSDKSQPKFKLLPRNGSNLLIASSIVGGNEKIDVVAPFATVKNAFATFVDGATPLQLIVTPKTSSTSDAEEEFNVDFNDK